MKTLLTREQIDEMRRHAALLKKAGYPLSDRIASIFPSALIDLCDTAEMGLRARELLDSVFPMACVYAENTAEKAGLPVGEYTSESYKKILTEGRKFLSETRAKEDGHEA